jgi:ABC-type uncharacterized transport system fused permease/ATPase subunit
MITLSQAAEAPLDADYRAELIRLQRAEHEIAKQQAADLQRILSTQRTATVITIALASLAVGTAIVAWVRTGRMPSPVVV